MRKVVPVLQMSQTECGLCAAAMLMDFYDVSVNIHDITSIFAVGRDGASIADLRKIFEYYRFDTNLYEVQGGLINLTNAALPCIAYHTRGHFVVIEAADDRQVTILDPAVGRMKISKIELIEDYKNVIVKVAPRDDFEKVNTRGNEFALLKTAMLENKTLVFKAALGAVLVYGIMLMVPMLLKVIVDNYLKAGVLNDQIRMASLAVLLSSLVYFVINRFKLTIGIQLSIALDKFLTKRVIDKLFKNKFEYFLNRTSSDIQYRLALLKSLNTVISDVLIQTVLDVGSMIVIFIYILQLQTGYALLLSFITIFVLGFSVLIRDRMLLYKNEELTKDNKLQILQYDVFRSIFDVKVLGLSQTKHKVWRDYYEDYLVSHRKSQLFSSFYKNILAYITLYVPIFIPLLGIWLSGIASSNEIGTIISLQSLTGIYITGLVSISELADNITSVKSYIVRVEDVLVQEDERDGKEKVELHGNLEISHLSFTYPGAKEKVLSDVSFQIKAGQSVAIVGESGSGKSTLFYILLGAYEDYQGSVSYEGRELKNLQKDQLRQQIGVVPQNALLFNGSIKENLSQDPNITDERIYEVLKEVSMYDFVQELPMGVNTQISENGFNLSGGQKQRLALARAIIEKKSILFLDEATSSLDNLTEQRVVDYLGEVSQTKIVIAHRLSTIRDSDQIIVMRDGEIAEIGSHNQLMDQKGVYYQMYFKDTEGVMTA
ncbi:peptidase domain-containing ABC transporter [Streptococcus sp. H31]|uniref:peptidase domain-containing ABC transporter n=1 Tax=Streptococcus huangxiaojuni TaxID=3237239 RepID=UPI0034A2F52D